MLNLLLILIFIRPFISGLLFPLADIYYSAIFLLFSLLWLSIRKKPVFGTSVNYPLIFFFLSVVLSCLLSPNIAKSFKAIHKYLTYLAGFYLAAQANDKERSRIILTIFSVSAAIAIIALFQRIFGFPSYSFNFAKKYLEQGRVFSTFVTPTVFGGYTILIIPLIAGFFYDHKQKVISQPLIYLGIVLIGCLLLTKSIGAFLGLSVGLMVFFILTASLNKKTLFLIFAIFTALFFVLLTFRNYLHPENLPEFSNTVIQRKMFWHDTWEIIKKFPFKGIGLGNFAISGTNFAHNSYLQIWAEMGILAILSYLWLIFACLKAGFLRLKMMQLRDFPNTGILSGLLAANCAFLAHNLVDFTFFTPEVALYCWIMLGLIISFRH